jgi:hypothetical protein
MQLQVDRKRSRNCDFSCARKPIESSGDKVREGTGIGSWSSADSPIIRLM